MQAQALRPRLGGLTLIVDARIPSGTGWAKQGCDAGGTCNLSARWDWRRSDAKRVWGEGGRACRCVIRVALTAGLRVTGGCHETVVEC